MIASIPITVTPHRSLNSCKGVVRSYDLAQMDDAELLSELQSQNVTEVRGISVTKDGMRRRTSTTIVIFAQPTIPPSLKAGYLSIPVQQYFPNPLRCFKCQKYGHHQTLCKHSAACARAARRRTAMIRALGHRTASTAAVHTLHLTKHVPNGSMKKK